MLSRRSFAKVPPSAFLACGIVSPLAWLAAGCALAPPDRVNRTLPGARTAAAWIVDAADVDVRVEDRTTVRTARGTALLRLSFSFISYEGYVAEDDLYESTGTLYLPLGSDGNPRSDPSGLAILTEYPPGAARVAFPLLAEYGERPAAELGIPAAVVDVRGPVASRIGEFVNPDDPGEGTFTSERQFAYAMLRSYQATNDARLLYETQAAGAWLRALVAVSELLVSETGSSATRAMLCGEGTGGLAAAQAGAIDDGVVAVVVAGWPLRFRDYHFVRARRWEDREGIYPLRDIAPSVWLDSRDVLSFLASTRQAPDPGCPECEGAGDAWLRQFDLGALHATGRLRGALFLLEGDEDPDLPIDLVARASVPREALVAPPPRVPPGAGSPGAGPFATLPRVPYDDLRMLRGGTSTLVRPDAAEAVRAWAQTVNGYRELPLVTATEEVREGDLVVTVHALEGNAPVTHVTVRVLEADPHRPFDFKAAVHRDPPEPVAWRTVPAHYAGHTRDFGGRWVARTPYLPGENQAYSVSVETRIGETVTESSLPVRPLWNRGDPAGGVLPW